MNIKAVFNRGKESIVWFGKIAVQIVTLFWPTSLQMEIAVCFCYSFETYLTYIDHGRKDCFIHLEADDVVKLFL